MSVDVDYSFILYMLEKGYTRLYNIPYRTHNILVHHIVNSYPIDVVLEKRCIKYIWNLINSGCKLHADIVILLMDNNVFNYW